MRVLVTGAAGFIGSHVCEAFLARGWGVWGFDNFTTGRQENLRGSGAEIARIDVADRGSVYGFANQARPDLVVHCAASYSDPDKWHRDVDTNVTGTVNVVLAARHHDARLFYFQTSLPPLSSYGISKHAGEQYIKLSEVDQVTFRLANVYGPRNLSGPIPAFFKRLRAGEQCVVVDTQRDMVFIDDLVDAVEKAVDRPDVNGSIDICSGRLYSIRQLYDAVAFEMGNYEVSLAPQPQLRPRGDDDVPGMFLHPDQALRLLDWEASTPLHTGVARTVAWYSEHGVEETFTHLRQKESV